MPSLFHITKDFCSTASLPVVTLVWAFLAPGSNPSIGSHEHEGQEEEGRIQEARVLVAG